MPETLIRNWGFVALRGVAAILFGILAFSRPGITLVALITLYGAYVFVDGVFTIAAVIAHRGREQHWVAMLLTGLLGIAAGIVAFIMPGITALVLLIVIAVWAIMAGVAQILAAIRLRKLITGEWLLALAGVLSVAFGVLLIAQPGPGALALVFWIGAFALAFGVLQLALALRLRGWGRSHHIAGMTPHPA
jgi:uncharacterized membrane protein HdeD (DUF308 family)